MAVDLCAHRQDEVECLRYIACDKPAAFTAVSPPRNICLCGNFHRRYQAEAAGASPGPSPGAPRKWQRPGWRRIAAMEGDSHRVAAGDCALC
ncbi:unnamed protein product [Spirodela intermedia]|uniref:Uncharacterized protein n=1 Tax=Spirodela intermedia TaxID=51605 RepID=A0A7I8JLA1_SPIIN|nr:unnamed protein product [Spirodela intermedia]CAA6670363.1 unnamed protein product [Spirodela intermedia]